jgi:hypothetical protein
MCFWPLLSPDGTESPVWIGWDSITSAAILFLLCQVLTGANKVPIALLAFVYGLAVAMATHPEVLGELSLGISLPAPMLPTQVCQTVGMSRKQTRSHAIA